MTDERAKEVVESLRLLDCLQPTSYLRDAADELERLRAENTRAFRIHRANGSPCAFDQSGGPSCQVEVHYQPVTYDDWAERSRALIAKDAEIARLREALKPFADLWEIYRHQHTAEEVSQVGIPTPLSDLKRAAEVLK